VAGKRATQNQVAVAGPSITEFPVTLFAANFQARGVLHSPGVLQTFLNDDQRSTVVIYNADVIGFESTNPAARVSVPELIVRKVSCQLIAFDRRPLPDQYTLLPRAEPAAVYTDQFLIEGNFHMGADSRLADFADTSLQQFIVASDARIYPLFQPRAALIGSAPMIALHKSSIRFYHATPSGM
jgi:hypothetical protein